MTDTNSFPWEHDKPIKDWGMTMDDEEDEPEERWEHKEMDHVMGQPGSNKTNSPPIPALSQQAVGYKNEKRIIQSATRGFYGEIGAMYGWAEDAGYAKVFEGPEHARQHVILHMDRFPGDYVITRLPEGVRAGSLGSVPTSASEANERVQIPAHVVDVIAGSKSLRHGGDKPYITYIDVDEWFRITEAMQSGRGVVFMPADIETEEEDDE